MLTKKQSLFFIRMYLSHMCWQKSKPFILAQKTFYYWFFKERFSELTALFSKCFHVLKMPELVFSNYVDKKYKIFFILDVQSYMCWQKFNPFILARKRVPVMFSWKNHVPTSLSCFLIILSVLKTLELVFYTYVDKNINYFLSRMHRTICVDKNSKPSFW